MKKINWAVEEAVALMNLYIENDSKIPVDANKVKKLSNTLKKRAERLNLDIDEKFRNVAGLNMQLACIHYVATDGKEGLSGASELFYDTYKLYLTDKKMFLRIYDDFSKIYQ